MKLPCLFQFRILKVALASLFGRPYTNPFPKGGYTPNQRYRGRPRYNENECIGCGGCAEVVPSNAIDLVDDTAADAPHRTLIHHLDTCIQCGQCERYCTSEKGIKLTNEWDYVGFARKDFEEGVDRGFEPGDGYPVRARRINIQCPHCRRKTAMTV